MSGSGTEVDALQTTLAAEHAAVWLYGLLGARTSQSAEAGLYTAVRAAYDAHRERRDALTGDIASLGASPVGSAPAYTPPAGLDTAAGRASAALVVERSCAETYAALVGSTTGERRTRAVGMLADAAVRELSFGGEPEAFPGLPSDSLS
ncbi:DUF4439 domain-containing protein [Nocardioides flavescens]|uniref:DUF4439 domain-containing protein n=1 Tax=Nocardioides flavescens TaxID=2691959 RepID=A0A6L7EL47_9ACTN|nr:DUF4439 domain-containing protein [Nocardioides flavescens]